MTGLMLLKSVIGNSDGRVGKFTGSKCGRLITLLKRALARSNHV